MLRAKQVERQSAYMLSELLERCWILDPEKRRVVVGDCDSFVSPSVFSMPVFLLSVHYFRFVPSECLKHPFISEKARQKKAEKAAQRKKQLAEASFEPRYVPPDTSKLAPDPRGPPIQPPKVPVDERFYLTTAINYTNGKPHIGHAYEAITSDVLSRYHRTYGREVYFLTGSDEHGKKVQQSAEKEGVTPIEIADRYSNGFQALNRQVSRPSILLIRCSSIATLTNITYG